jgi:hypothetical protein
MRASAGVLSRVESEAALSSYGELDAISPCVPKVLDSRRCTHPAVFPVLVEICVLQRVAVSVRALLFVATPTTTPTRYIYFARDRFEVIWVYATSVNAGLTAFAGRGIVACVIEVHPWRDLPSVKFVRKTVSFL